MFENRGPDVRGPQCVRFRLKREKKNQEENDDPRHRYIFSNNLLKKRYLSRMLIWECRSKLGIYFQNTIGFFEISIFDT